MSVSDEGEKFTGLMLAFDFDNRDSARHIYEGIADTLKKLASVTRNEADEFGRIEILFVWKPTTSRYLVVFTTGPYYNEKAGKFYVSLSLRKLDGMGFSSSDNK
jgi:hypothetical protein